MRLKNAKGSTIINQYINFIVEDDSSSDNKKRIKSRNTTYFMAKSVVRAKNDKYKFKLFIGDAKQSIGEFELTINEAGIRNKNYRNKFFNSTDESYRLRTLKMTKESGKKFYDQVEKEFIKLRQEYNETKTITETTP